MCLRVRIYYKAHARPSSEAVFQLPSKYTNALIFSFPNIIIYSHCACIPISLPLLYNSFFCHVLFMWYASVGVAVNLFTPLCVCVLWPQRCRFWGEVLRGVLRIPFVWINARVQLGLKVCDWITTAHPYTLHMHMYSVFYLLMILVFTVFDCT